MTFTDIVERNIDMKQLDQELYGIGQIVDFAISRFELEHDEKAKARYYARVKRYFKNSLKLTSKDKLGKQDVIRLLEIDLFEYFAERSRSKRIVEEGERRRRAYRKASSQGEELAQFLQSQTHEKEDDYSQNAVPEANLHNAMMLALLKALFYGVYGKDFDERSYRLDYANYYQRGLELTPSIADTANKAYLDRLGRKLQDASNYMVVNEKVSQNQSNLPLGSSEDELRMERSINASGWGKKEHPESLIQSLSSLLSSDKIDVLNPNAVQTSSN